MSYRAHNLVTAGRTDGRTDGQTDADNDNTNMPILASDKNLYKTAM